MFASEVADSINISWKSGTVGAPWQRTAEEVLRESVAAALNGGIMPTVYASKFTSIVGSLPSAWATHMRHQLQDQTTLALWRQHKTMYLLDVDLWNSLADTDPAGQIPPEVFTRLPHPNPYIAFPEPVNAVAGNGDLLRVGGFWLTGKKDVPNGAVLCSTHDPDVSALALLFAGVAVDPATGEPIRVPLTGINGVTYDFLDITLSRTSVLFEPSTLEEHIRRALRSVYSPDVSTPAYEAAMLPSEAIAGLVRTAIIALVYLCSDEADIDTALPPERRRKRNSGEGTPPRVHPVGYRIGAALRSHRAKQASGSGQDTGRTVAPHIRRAHFHTFRAGPGRSERRVKWLPPIPVKMDGVEGDVDMPTVHKVR